ncbi:GNAT family N-acetyltransferase [Thaumasiovibrio subtropicus]|uniref:GNAT family N-acetyltransferase n=1 Tax=Thaumasiovibrio subtropicus TaxID=1891207 RepID=UPI000B3540FA|nr:GNAT family N-acetyltransferase [Thaumasiovibrio subtropicus]
MDDYLARLHISQITPEETVEIRHKVLWPSHNKSSVILEEDALGHHFGAYIDGKLISVASVFICKAQSSARLRKFATLPSYQGNGVGSALIHSVLGFLKAKQVAHFWCDARLSACSFYEKLDMKPRGKPFKKKDVDYIVMERILG